jgi:hypothetical protein
VAEVSGDDELERAALGLCDRYVREVVLGFGLCPWAEPALTAGRVMRAVCLSPAPVPADCVPFIDRFATSSEPVVDIGLLIFPRHTGGWAAFDAFAERVRRADKERQTPGAGPTFLIAAFHPGGAETFADAHQLVSLLRRSPDPLLQFVRAEAIARVKAKQPGASDEIARRNHDALVGGNANRLASLLRAIRDIAAERDARYDRRGLNTNSS